MRDLEIIRSKHGFISDMDGVIYQGSQLLPGVKEFVDWLRKEKKQFPDEDLQKNVYASRMWLRREIISYPVYLTQNGNH